MTEERQNHRRDTLKYVAPLLNIGLGAYIGGASLNLSDDIAKSQTDAPDWIYPAIGAGLILYGIGLYYWERRE